MKSGSYHNMFVIYISMNFSGGKDDDSGGDNIQRVLAATACIFLGVKSTSKCE